MSKHTKSDEQAAAAYAGLEIIGEFQDGTPMFGIIPLSGGCPYEKREAYLAACEMKNEEAAALRKELESKTAAFIFMKEAADGFSKQRDESVQEVQKLSLEILDLQKQRDEMLAALKGIRDLLYGQGLEVSGWHQNGDHESMDSFFDNNGWLDALARAEGRKP